MKIYLNKPKENWIVDRFVSEWSKNNLEITSKRISKSDIVWIISPWTWRRINKKHLKIKKVICTIHHIDPNKFDKNDFYELDQYVDYYHVISEKTVTELKKHTNKKIYTIPFWVDDKKWFSIQNKQLLKESFNFDEASYLVGSFQRDTEKGKDLLPKLEKGPDILLNIIKKLNTNHPNLHIVLAGKRRGYLIKELKKEGIKFTYFEMIKNSQLNELYNCLDLYIVSSRIEGGPASIMECALTKTPIISTDVGIANKILPKKSIFQDENYENTKPDIELAYSNVQKYIIPEGFNKFIKIFEEIHES